MMEEWLRSIGLEEHSASFRAQHVEFEQFPTLTDEELRELGLSIGERKRFREAIASTLVSSTASTFAERRPLTVMFVDLVGSTSLSEQLDAEVMLDILRVYRQFCGTIIAQYGGNVVRFVGDGILAYFCYPVAHENDPERAVRAALDIARGVRTLPSPADVPLRVRIGISTGRVIVSDVKAGGITESKSVIGATPNLAARLQALAPPNGVIVSKATHDRIAHAFACEHLGPHELKGFAAPQHVFEVVGDLAAEVEGRRSAGRLTALFGREDDLAFLERRWEQVLHGHGGLVIVSGEPGIGKSRLVEHFIGARRRESAAVVSLRASPFDENSALRPLLTYLQALAGLEHHDDDDTKLRKLNAALHGPAERHSIALATLRDLMGLGGGGVEPRSPAKLRERILAVFKDHFLALSDVKPLCIVVEDFHWLDPTSRDLITELATDAACRSVLILVTARPGEHLDALRRQAGVALRELHRLGDAEIMSMVQSLFGDLPVPASVARHLARRTDGVPLYVEELVRLLLQQGTSPDWSSLFLAETGSAAIPASLQEAFIARLDTTGMAKELAQIASVIGRVARRDVLGEVSGLADEELIAALDTLCLAGVLREERVGGRRCYEFAHALLRDAAYDTILRDRRRELHARVAQALEGMAADTISAQPEILAAHLTASGEAAKAVPYWLRAGRRSLDRAALIEACSLLRHALSTMDALPRTPDNLQQRLEIMALLGPALMGLKGPGSPELQKLYGEAYDMSRDVPEAQSYFPLYWGWWRVSRNYELMMERAGALLRRARERSDPGLLLQAHHCNWASHFMVGDLSGCCRHVEAGLAIYNHGHYRDHASLYGNHDAKVCAHGELAQVYWIQGRLGEAVGHEAQSLHWARQLNHLGSTIHAMDMALLYRSYRRQHAEVLRQADELMTFAAEQGFTDHHAKALIFRGWALAMLDDPKGGLEAIEIGLARQREIGTIEDFPMYVCLHAEALMASNRADVAVAELTDARHQFDAVGLRNWLPEVWRTTGDVILAADPQATSLADEAYMQAARGAAEQGAGMLALRTAVSRARLARRMRRPEFAFQALQEARLQVTGEGELDLVVADRLLADLKLELGIQ